MGKKVNIHFVTGKGGVGKSTVAAAMALQSSLQGKKTLLVELGHQSFFKDFFSIPQISYKPMNLRENFDIALWSGGDCLKEYALHLLKIQGLYKLFFENPVSRALVNIAPALPELSILGKITSGIRHIGPEMNYDTLIVDAYATGHFLSLLRAPKGVSEAIKLGPMGDQSREIFQVITDPSICRYSIVSFPEEMPVAESLELSKAMQQEFKIQPLHILNKIFPSSDGTGSPAFEECLAQQKANTDQARAMMKEQKLVELPFIFEVDPWKIINGLAKVIQEKNSNAFS